jgi:ABC-type uncharacterized transport system permease subunit
VTLDLLLVMTPRFMNVPRWLDAGCCIILTFLALGALAGSLCSVLLGSLQSRTVEFNRHNQHLVIMVVRLFARGISYDGTD